jgi:DNA-binding response OmpR family regulator
MKTRSVKPDSPVHPLKVVLVDDEPGILDCLEFVIRSWFQNLALLRFTNGSEAWQELSRTDPDLLITDDMMPVLDGGSLCLRLLERKVCYPIIVYSSWEPTEKWVADCALQGLNIYFLPMPFQLESLRGKIVEAGFFLPQEKHLPQLRTPAE